MACPRRTLVSRDVDSMCPFSFARNCKSVGARSRASSNRLRRPSVGKIRKCPESCFCKGTLGVIGHLAADVWSE
eukprot:84534-Amphidinium_carterae.1